MINKKLKVVLGVLFGIILLVSLVYFVGFRQSVLSLSEIKVGTDGKVYWVFFASANKANEQYLFTSLPGKYTQTDGSTVTPKSQLTLVINPKQPQCIYQVTKSSYSSIYPYYDLSSPERQADIEITDRDGKSYIMSGVDNTQLVINDKDGNGKVVVESQGLLSGRFDCPSPSDVVLVRNKDGSHYALAYKSQIIALINSGSFNQLLTLVGLGRTPEDATTFINSFSLLNYDFNTNILIGDINLGYPTFTITADQDYYNSVSYIPPKSSAPFIESINCPDKIRTGDGSTCILKLINKNANTGNVNIIGTSSVVSISPSSTTVSLTDSKDISFNIVGGTENCGDISFNACSVSQFSSSQVCSSKSQEICITSTAPVTTCGDNICQSNENINGCPEDCSNVIPTPTEECRWFEESYSVDKIDCGFLGWKQIIGLCKPYTEKGCKTSGIVLITVIGSMLFILGLVIIFVFRPKHRGGYKK